MTKFETPARQKWREILLRQGASGLSASVFCRGNGVALSSFFAWKRKLSGPVSPGFVEAKVVGAPARPDTIQVRLRGGRKLIVSLDLLAQVIAVVEGLP